MLRKQPLHLVYRLDVEFVAGELHAVLIVVELSGPDAEERVVHLRVLTRGVVAVVRRDEVQPGIFVQLEQALVDPFLLRDVQVVLHLQKHGVEDFLVLLQQLPRLVHPAFEDAGRDFSREAPGEADDALAVLAQLRHVHPRLTVEAFEKAGRRELHQVLVALGGAGE